MRKNIFLRISFSALVVFLLVWSVNAYAGGGEVEDMEEIACPAAAVMAVTGETVPLEEVAMGVMEETANKVPVETAGMEATVLEEGEKEVLVVLDLMETDRMEIMETLDN